MVYKWLMIGEYIGFIIVYSLRYKRLMYKLFGLVIMFGETSDTSNLLEATYGMQLETDN